MRDSKNKIKGIVNLDGGATYDLENQNVIFVPNVSVPDMVERYRKRGTGMQMSDGTFEFVPRKLERHTGRLLKKLPHGSLTEARDGRVRLVLVFDPLKESRMRIAWALQQEGRWASEEMCNQ